jgi:hypothetical protein
LAYAHHLINAAFSDAREVFNVVNPQQAVAGWSGWAAMDKFHHNSFQ